MFQPLIDAISQHMRDMNIYHSKKNRTSLLPPGEGQDEGIEIKQLLYLFPLPNPPPEGEGAIAVRVCQL